MPPLAADSLTSAGASFGADAAEDVLNFVGEKRVFPVVGPGLATVQTDAGGGNPSAWPARTPAGTEQLATGRAKPAPPPMRRPSARP